MPINKISYSNPCPSPNFMQYLNWIILALLYFMFNLNLPPPLLPLFLPLSLSPSLFHWSGLSGVQIFGIVFSSLVVVCCGACCLCLLIGFIYHKKLKRKNARSHRSLNFQASQSYTVNSHPYTTAPQELSTINTSHTSIAMLKQADAEPSVPPLEAAVTHAGEAPPAYNTVVRYKTVDLDTHDGDVQLSSACTWTECSSLPMYKETL